MAVTTDELAAIGTVLSGTDAGTQLFADLRRRFPHLAWTRCDASDVSEAPFRSYPVFDLHLLDGSDRCPQITADPARATGLVLAKRTAVP